MTPVSPSINGVSVTELKTIATDGGQVMHGLRQSEAAFNGFGEVYFSGIESGCIRGWKRHREMTLNLVVVTGQIRFVLVDGRENVTASGKPWEILLSPADNYARLTVPPGIWMAFQGLGEPGSLLANIANMEHDPSEADQAPLNQFHFNWQKV